jgi:hypothetical protein
VNYFPSRFDPVRHSEKVPIPSHVLTGKREKVREFYCQFTRVAVDLAFIVLASITKVDIEAGIGCCFFEEAANACSGSLCAVKPSIFIWIVQVMIEKENNFAQPGARYRSWAPDRYNMKLFLSNNAFLLCPIASLHSGLDVFEVR